MQTAIALNIIGFLGLVGVGAIALTAPEPSLDDGPANIAVFERVATDGTS